MEIICDQVRIFCDPWLVGKAFDGSWWQWPPLQLQPEDFTDYTHLYISHIHSDHCDVHTLRRLPNKDAPVIILKSADGFLKKAITSCGFKHFIELDEGQSVRLKGSPKDTTVTMYSAFAPNPFIDVEVPNIIDSSIVVECDGQRFLNLNDNTPDEEACHTLKQRWGYFTAATVPYSGVGPFPSSYENLSLVQKQMRSDHKSQQYLDRMVSIAAILQADLYFPAAGQMRLGGRQMHKNEVLGVAGQDVATMLLTRKGFKAVHLQEGDLYNLSTNEHQNPIPPRKVTSTELEAMGNAPYPWEHSFRVGAEDRIEMLPLLQGARQRLTKHQAKHRFTAPWLMAIRIEELPESVYVFSFATIDSVVEKRVTKDLLGGSESFLMVTVPYNYLLAILTRHGHWNNAYHGCQVEWLRQPDDYVPELQTLLSYFHL